MSPAIVPKIETDHNEDSMDFSPPMFGSSDSQSSFTPVTTSSSSTPIQTTPVPKKLKEKKKLVTGYILYSSEVRKSVAEKNPDKGFGEISRMVGTDVRTIQFS